MDDERRRSPTPPHNTREFATWVDFAVTAIDALKDYPASPETAGMMQELEHFRVLFEGWTADKMKRPAPGERTPHMTAFMSVRGRALDLLVRLAKEHPEVAARAAARYREAARLARSRGGV